MTWTRKTAALAAALVWLSPSVGHALSPFNTIADWMCALEQDRITVGRILANTAGQGFADMRDDFFMSCINERALDPSAAEATIATIATSCVFLHLSTFSETG